MCKKVSAGCTWCYAERMQPRFGNGPGKYDGRGEIYLDEKTLTAPLRWRKPRRVFVCSMTDLFWSKVPNEWIEDVFTIAALRPWHTFQVLTKRPGRMRDWFQDKPVGIHWQEARDHVIGKMLNFRRWKLPEGQCQTMRDRLLLMRGWPLPNVWLGVSVENQETWDERVPILCQIPAAVRFVSYEPALGPLNCLQMHSGIARPDRPIHWLIAGGESGANARPAQVEWFQSVCRQCEAAGVAFFMKQGSSANWPSYKDFDSFPTELQVREYPEVS